MKKITRVDIFTDINEYMRFMDWARTKQPKTKADMVRLLGEYKRADLYVDGHPEHVEHKIDRAIKEGKIGRPKGERE